VRSVSGFSIYIYIYIYIFSLLFVFELINLCHGVCSSGTSAGEPKLMPSIAEDLDRRTFLYNLIMPVMNQLNTCTSINPISLSFFIYIFNV